jgi:hypothetical protein
MFNNAVYSCVAVYVEGAISDNVHSMKLLYGKKHSSALSDMEP